MKSHKKLIFAKLIPLITVLSLIIAQIFALSSIGAYDYNQPKMTGNSSNSTLYETKPNNPSVSESVTIDKTIENPINTDIFSNSSNQISDESDMYLTEDNDFIRTSANGSEYLKSEIYNLQIEVSGDKMIVNVLDWELGDSKIPNMKSDGCNPLKEFSYIKSLTVSLGVMSVGENSFENFTKLESIIIEDGVEEIGQGSFSGCSSLTQLSIPSTAIKIGKTAFLGCNRIIDLKDNTADMNLAGGLLDKGIIESCLNLFRDGAGNGFLTRVSIDSKGSEFIFAIKDNMYYLIGCNSDNTIMELPFDIDEKPYNIYKYAFSNCTNIEKIIIPDIVTQIYDNSFYGCNTLKSIEIKGNPLVSECVFGGIEAKISIICPSDSDIRNMCDGDKFIYESPAEENQLNILYSGEDYLVTDGVYKVRFFASLNSIEFECAGFVVYAYVLDHTAGEYKMINSAVVGSGKFNTEIKSLADDQVILKSSNDKEACFISLLINNIPVDGEYDFCLTPIVEDKNHNIIYGKTTHIYIIHESDNNLNIMRDDNQSDNPPLPSPDQIKELNGSRE